MSMQTAAPPAPSPGTDLLSGAAKTPSTAPPATTPAAATSTSTFPGSTPDEQNGLPPPPNMTVAQFTTFAAQHGVSSTEVGNFINTATGTLTGWATEFLNYYQANSESRQAIQDQLVDADLLAESSANGSISSTPNTAFNTAMSEAIKQGVPLNQYLQSAAGPGQIQQLIAKQSSAAETMQATQTPTSFSYTDPNTLTADLASAFEAAVGHAPTAAQTATFISNFHGQEASDAAAYKQSYVATANADQAQIQKETAALDNLPSTELDKFIAAYKSAIGSPNQQGPAVGTVAGPTAPAQYTTPGANAASYVTGSSPLTGGRNIFPPFPAVAGSPAGTQQGMIRTPTKGGPPSYQQPFNAPPTGLSGAAARLTGTTPALNQSTTATAGVRATPSPQTLGLPAGTPGTSVVHGGEWAISPTLWQVAQELLPKTKLPSSPAQASAAMQTAAFTALAQYYQQQTGSWADTASILASGNPNASTTPASAGTGTVTGKPGTHIDNFTATVVNQTDAALTALTNEASSGPAVETIGKEVPNATDDALAAAKSADPAGYYSNQMSMYEGLLNQLLYGTPISEDTRQSNIQGPVLSDAGPSAAAPGPTSAPGPTGT